MNRDHFNRNSSERRPPHVGNSLPKKYIREHNLDKGLSSDTNKQHVLAILDHSTADQIESLLAQARFPLQAKTRLKLSDKELSQAIADVIGKFLGSPDGQREFEKEKRSRITLEVTDWLSSSTGQSELQRAKTTAAISETLKDADLLSQACKKAVDDHVNRWLLSPHGRESIELEKKRALQKLAETSMPKAIPDWVQNIVNQGGADGKT